MFLLLSAGFVKINFFQNILSETLSECQMVWIPIRTDTVSVLIWVQTVSKDKGQKIFCFHMLFLFEDSKQNVPDQTVPQGAVMLDNSLI